jgi:trans-AT polyketide synthase/acyltransferase/oxidoreductase domain-containing protein
MLAIVFPGQGSQHLGMGKDLFSKYPHIVAEADKILGYSVEEICLIDEKNYLNLTQYTQPLLYVVNYLHYLNYIDNNGIKPEALAGHSLGEYNALLVSEVFSFQDGLKLVKERGRLMSLAKQGAMSAILGISAEEIRLILQDNNLSSVDIANYNSPQQTVISGDKDNIEKADEILKSKAKRVVRLPVSGAFHSHLMNNASQEFEKFIQKFTLHSPKISVFSNLNAQPYESKDLYWNIYNQINHGVRWVETIQNMRKYGVTNFIEVGPQDVLTKLIAKI